MNDAKTKVDDSYYDKMAAQRELNNAIKKKTKTLDDEQKLAANAYNKATPLLSDA